MLLTNFSKNILRLVQVIETGVVCFDLYPNSGFIVGLTLANVTALLGDD